MTSRESGPQPLPADISIAESEAITFTQELITIESVNTGDPATIGDGEARAAKYVQAKLEEFGYECTYLESLPGRGNLVTRLPGADPTAGALVVHAHLDVVPAKAEDWTVPPFSGEIRDGYLWGRGAVDMKNMAGMITAIARDLKREKYVPPRDLIFAFLADEEAAGTYGAQWLVRHHPELFAGATQSLSEVGGFSVTLPGGNRRVYPIATAEKGVAWAELRARGRAGHGSMPHPDNAVGRLAAAVARVAEHEFPIVRTPAVEAFFDKVGELTGLPFADEHLQHSLDALGSFGSTIGATLRNTASPTVFHAGYKSNVIPAEATASIDCRVLPGSEDSFRAEVAHIVGPEIDIDWVWQPPIASDTRSEFVEKAEKALLEHDPDGVVVPYLLPASTDNKHLAKLGIEGYGWVPLEVPADFDVLGHFHAVDERIPLSSLAFGTRVLGHLLRDC